MLETLNGGGSMQPLTPALSLKGGFAKFPFSVIPAKPGPDIGGWGAGSGRRSRLVLAILRQGNGRGFPLGTGCCSLLRPGFGKLLWIPA